VSEFAARLKRTREAKGMSLYRLAALTGISRQGIINLEQPDADPKLSTVEKVAKALGVGEAELIGGPQATTPTEPPARAEEGLPDSWFAWSEWDEAAGKDRLAVRGKVMRVYTAEDDHRRMRLIWSFVEDARDNADIGVSSVREAIRDLESASEAARDGTPCVSVDWHRFSDEIVDDADAACSVVKNEVIPLIEKSNGITPAARKAIEKAFGWIDAFAIYVDPHTLNQWAADRREEYENCYGEEDASTSLDFSKFAADALAALSACEEELRADASRPARRRALERLESLKQQDKDQQGRLSEELDFAFRTAGLRKQLRQVRNADVDMNAVFTQIGRVRAAIETTLAKANDGTA
jgi:transcriptional regulator with XRE-family HTH domain